MTAEEVAECMLTQREGEEQNLSSLQRLRQFGRLDRVSLEILLFLRVCHLLVQHVLQLAFPKKTQSLWF